MASKNGHSTGEVGSHSSNPYTTICDVFQRHEDDVLEIEIISPGVLQLDDLQLQKDGTYIGVHKKALAKAFIVARDVFMRRGNPDVEPKVRPP